MKRSEIVKNAFEVIRNMLFIAGLLVCFLVFAKDIDAKHMDIGCSLIFIAFISEFIRGLASMWP